MPAVLHTADVHLRPDRPERTAALEAVLELAERTSVSVVTIGGDLFDRPSDAEALRGDLRNELFSGCPFDVLCVPGNHDVDAYRGDVFFGDACTVVTEEPFEHWTSPEDDLRITAIPYRDRPDDELLVALQDRDPFAGTEALVLHCSLEAPFDGFDAGDEDELRYFPVTTELLSELGFDYYLGGHYHGSHKVALQCGAEFTYPGTPASTSVSETGRRRVSLLDISTGIEFAPLETFHYASASFTASPGAERELLDDVRAWSDRHAVESAEATVHVDGFVEMDEAAFNDRLVRAAAPASVTDDTRGVAHVLSRPLFQSFEEELARREWDDETADAVRARTIDVFSRLAASREI